MATSIGIILIIVGAAVLLLGRRIAILAAGAGALLGLGIARLIPGAGTGVIALLLVFGLAIVCGLLAIFIKGITNIVVMAIGFIAGGGIVLAILDALSVSTGTGFISFILAVGGGLIGLVLANRFLDWALVILAGLVGGLAVMRGLQLLVPSLSQVLAIVIGLALAALGAYYQSRGLRK